MTCHNRREKTKGCLVNLFKQKFPEKLEMAVFVCDDGSIDGTKEMIGECFPRVQVVLGNGNLYWGGGMRMAWKEAQSKGEFDFFLWLNDDTNLYEEAILSLWNDYQQVYPLAIITGACQSAITLEWTYGGREEYGPIFPKLYPQKIRYINGNLVLIPVAVNDKLQGILPIYAHYIGDYDYGLRAQEAGFTCYTSSKYLASSEPGIIQYYGDPKYSLIKRLKLVYGVKGLAIKEYFHYKSYPYGKWVGIKTLIAIHLKALSASLYKLLGL
ncbi:glycosyltransferase [uncultured Algoriphagus sp.]|uniref:glycosyltransferase family 2 protein n=1 Tax=uncultured Algoriphagus sp. TaxID=417365 RepID=UPI002593FB76|nr:glycosyltransferase [uncultured Algoriphagus sp.]